MTETIQKIDKSTLVPLALVISLCGGLFWIGWNIASMNSKIDNLAEKMSDNKSYVDRQLTDHEVRIRNCELKFSK